MNAKTPLQAGMPPADARSIEMPRALPFMLNVLLAGALGAYLGGWLGALAGAGVLFALLGGFFLAPRIARARPLLLRAGARLWRVFRPLVGLVLLPPAASLAIAASLLILAWDRTLGRLNAPVVPVSRASLRLLGRVRALLFGLVAPENLPMTAVNALLLLVLGCVGIGIQVAFYAALAAVPVLICTLMMVAVESSREPGAGGRPGQRLNATWSISPSSAA